MICRNYINLIEIIEAIFEKIVILFFAAAVKDLHFWSKNVHFQLTTLRYVKEESILYKQLQLLAGIMTNCKNGVAVC
jgi:hypothetical protein